MTEAIAEISESVWFRSEFTSIWRGPDLELIVVQPPRTEGWQWTCNGWASPDDCDGADKSGWVFAASREAAERAALKFYMEMEH